ncbi:hypothetical protein D4Q52_14110 [Rhodopseudomonas palustris]|uniref:Uncharacterized protein n=1 Tax=Rhodopseudomonas palustris TaxID=1076 RepID=A0A418VDD1_RHOPL|nr:hypothetical protein D4Q52_14110 [Rhodopseudomonas palustris]
MAALTIGKIIAAIDDAANGRMPVGTCGDAWGARSATDPRPTQTPATGLDRTLAAFRGED